jgi:hypothetical protein
MHGLSAANDQIGQKKSSQPYDLHYVIEEWHSSGLW